MKNDEGKILKVTILSKAFALAVPAPEAIQIRDDVGFFQAVRSVLKKTTGDGEGPKHEEEVEHNKGFYAYRSDDGRCDFGRCDWRVSGRLRNNAERAGTNG